MMKKFIFADDSGDSGLRDSSSNVFVIAAIAFDDMYTIRRVDDVMCSMRTKFKWPDTVEFKFRKTNKDLVKKILIEMCKYNFEIYATYINKMDWQKLKFDGGSEQLYNFTIAKLLEMVPFDYGIVKMDGHSGRKSEFRTAAYVRKNINADRWRMRSFKTVDSKNNQLIQLADLVAGAIHRSLSNEKNDAKVYAKIISDKIVKIRCLDPKDFTI